MVMSDLARRSADDSSSALEDCEHKTIPGQSLRSDDSESRKNDSDVSPAASFSISDSPSQHFSRQWHSFGTLLDDALAKVVAAAVASTISSSSSQQQPHRNLEQRLSEVGHDGTFSDITNVNLNSRNTSANTYGNTLKKLVQEKQSECLVLQQNIDSQKSEMAQLHAIIDSLRESSRQQTGNVKKLRLALQRASKNATSARDEANKAEAMGATLTSKVDTFQTVVQETKRSSALLLHEQEEIMVGFEGMENEFVQVQADLACHKATRQKMQEKNRSLSRHLWSIKNRLDRVQANLDLQQSESLLTKRKYEDLQGIVEIQQSRSERLQEDFDSTQALLVDSTDAAAESKLALQDCKQTINRMEDANRHLHQQLQKHQATLRNQEASHQDEINRINKDHQETQLQLSQQRDMFRALKLEKLAAEKRQESQAAKIFALERRLKESTNLMTTTMSLPSDPQHQNVVHPAKDTSMKEDRMNSDLDSCNQKHSSKLMDDAFAIPRLHGKEEGEITAAKKTFSFA